MTYQLSRSELLERIDHTLLVPEATRADIERFLADARTMGVHRVCISPTLLPQRTKKSQTADAAPALEFVTVIGFPSGAHAAAVKVAEAERALADGAAEIDAVANLGFIKAGDVHALQREFADLRAATAGHPLKIILETACLTSSEIVAACNVARDTGCDFVKTSTGFHSAGGATVEAVKLMAATVGADVGVKASGGIRSAAQARQMLRAGATRLGVSATQRILEEWDRIEQVSFDDDDDVVGHVAQY